MKKGLVLLLVFLMTFTLIGCGGDDETEEVPKNPDVVLVTDENGLGDNGFNDLCWAGCTKAADDFDIEIYCIESESEKQYMESINEAAVMEPDIVICAGPKMSDALTEVAKANPECKFAIVDSQSTLKNIMGIIFKEEEGSFLAGVAAGLMTKEDIISFIGGQQSIKTDKYQYGFEAGAASVNSKAYINNQYIGNFKDADEANKITTAHAALGSDIVYHAAGDAGKGVIQAAESKKIWAIGCDRDQSYLSDKAVLCSVIKKADFAVYDVINTVINDKFEGKDIVYSLADGALEISDEAGNIPADVMKVINEYKEKIIKGEITVPYDWQTCNDFKAKLNQEK